MTRTLAAIPRSLRDWSERLAGEHVERGEYAARLVRHVGELEPHLDAAERAGERQVVQIAEVPDSEDLPLQLAEPRAERHVEALEHDLTERIRVAPLGHHHGGEHAAVFIRIHRNDVEAPRLDGGARRAAEALVARDDVVEPLVLNHQQRLAQAEENVR